VPVLLTVVAALCVGALAYGASAVITYASRRSLLVSTAIAVAMALGFVGFVIGTVMVMRKP
jgi:hypothetical protein